MLDSKNLQSPIVLTILTYFDILRSSSDKTLRLTYTQEEPRD